MYSGRRGRQPRGIIKGRPRDSAASFVRHLAAAPLSVIWRTPETALDSRIYCLVCKTKPQEINKPYLRRVSMHFSDDLRYLFSFYTFSTRRQPTQTTMSEQQHAKKACSACIAVSPSDHRSALGLGHHDPGALEVHPLVKRGGFPAVTLRVVHQLEISELWWHVTKSKAGRRENPSTQTYVTRTLSKTNSGWSVINP